MSNFDDYFALHEKKAYREAYVVLREIMESQPRWSKEGDLYVWCADLELTVNDDVREARKLLDKAHELGCKNMAPYYRVRGYVLWRSGDHNSGLQCLEKSVELDPNVTNLATFGEMLSFDYDKRALWVWKRVLAQDPDNCSAHIYLGIEAVKSGDRDKALDMVKRAENLSPTIRDYLDIGRLYYELELYQDALNVLLDADKGGYEPKGFLYSFIGACYCSMGDYDAAIDYSSRAIDMNFDDDYAKEILLSCTEEGEVCDTLGILLEERHDTSLASIIHAQEAFRDKDLSKARKMTSDAELLDPSPAEMYSIAHLWYELRDLERSLEALLKADKLGYNDKPRLYEPIAYCYYCLEKYDAAIQYAFKMLAIDPDDAYAKEILYSCRKEVWGSEFGDNY